MRKITKEILLQTARFIFVGALNTLVDFLVFNFLAHYVIGLASPWAYFACKSLGFIVAMINSFFFNSRFTFKQHERKSGLWWRFGAVTIATFAISSAISTEAFYLMQTHTSISAIVAGNISVAVSVAMGMLTNFFGYKFLVFEDHEELA